MSSRIVASVNLIPSAASVTAISMSLNSRYSFSVLEKTTKSELVYVKLASFCKETAIKTYPTMCAGFGLV